ncbi:YcxB family protein [Exiguobacterium acetylicum]|uniref:YcxB family protein n=1 Tax=Exiguobacterium acetylicum TaxID=41170 RepID=UPI003977ADEE
MKLHYQTTIDDYLALQKDYFKRGRYHQSKSNITFVALAMIVFLLGMIVFTILINILFDFLSENMRDVIIVCLSLIPVFLLKSTLVKYYEFMTIRQLKSSLKHDDSWPRDVTLEVNETRILAQSSYKRINKKTEVEWGDIKVVGEDDERLFLYYESNEALILPKGTQRLTEVESNAIRELLKKHVKSVG